MRGGSKGKLEKLASLIPAGSLGVIIGMLWEAAIIGQA